MAWLIVAVSLLFSSAGRQEDAVKAELAKLQGTWHVIGVEENGQKTPEDKLKEANGTVTIQADKHTLKLGGQDRGTATIKLDPNAKPKQYDLHITEGPEKGKVLQGIYELEGDTWRLCLSKDGKSRPTEFAGKANTTWVLVTMKKEKAGEGKK
jgi:uncharacterized protein (TIGR03067 family)